MKGDLNSRKGFTLTEIITSAMIVVIAVEGTYCVYILSRKFSDRFKHRASAWNYAAKIADELKARHSYNEEEVGQVLEKKEHDSSTDPDLLTTTGWDFYNEVNVLKAKYIVSDVWFDNDGNEMNQNLPGDSIPDDRPPFKKIAVTISWDER